MKTTSIIIILLCAQFISFAQDKTNKKNSEYKFTVTKNLESTSVKDQGKSGTCWTFSTLSFFESELIRMGKGTDVDLSEMFVVRNAYPLKAENYVRMHGKLQFGEGGQLHDVPYIIKNFGMVPNEIYNGSFIKGGKFPYNHYEMDSVLAADMKTFVNQKTETIDPAKWKLQVNTTLDKYLGKVPETFEYKGKQYTPQSYAKELGIVADDYVYLTSFTHHPFYKPFVVEVPDNWALQQAHNLPLEDLIKVINNALTNGFTVGWDADVSEQYFRHKDGLAIVPQNWKTMTDTEKNSCFIKPVKEDSITQTMRQLAFDNYETQDDHLMHIVGMVKDQNNTTYYIVKNSWGTERNECGGYFYASEAYVKYKTISIMIHKKALPAEYAKKLSISLVKIATIN